MTDPLPRPTPRRVSDGSFESLLLVLNGVWILGSLLAIFLASVSIGPDWYRYWRLQQFGETTSGQVVRHDLGRNWHAYIYEFTGSKSTSPSPELFFGQQSVRAGRFPPLAAGQTITVRYLASNPEISVIERFFRAPPKAPLLYVTMGLLALAGGGLLLPARWQNWHRIYRLRRDGHVTPAKIVNRWRTVEPQSNRDMFCVAYQFETNQARSSPQTILTAEDNQLAYTALRIGQTTPVRYWPAAPEQCRLEIEPLLERQAGGLA